VRPPQCATSSCHGTSFSEVRSDGCSTCACRGLPLHEAMAMGLPTISTDWGGNTQFMLPRNSYLIQ
jgi:glycosyltransferase involved in cell wall biosynthesis